MILISPGNDSYKSESRIPLIHVPLDAQGQDHTLEDFQWWSYSKDFREWMKKNPREWTAESMSTGNGLPILESERYRNIDTFSDFVNEAEGDIKYEGDAGLFKKAVKFNYAFNRLLVAGKIGDTFKADEIDQNEQALFMTFAGEEGDEEGIPETMQAYRVKGIRTSSDKFNIIQMDYALPYSEEIATSNFKEVAENVLESAGKSIAAGAFVAGIFLVSQYALAGAGTMILFRFLKRRSVDRFLNVAKAAKKTNNIRKARRMVSTMKGVKGTLGTIKDMATLKNTRAGAAAAFKASKIKNIRPVGLLRAFMKGAGISKLFPKFMGKAGAKVGGKAIAKAIPFVGEVLMAADAVYSMWSWNRDSQAPKFSEVEDFAHGEFEPDKIKAGVPITVCWSQPSGSWLEWVATDETRTTMELIKIGTSKNRTLFLMTQANSKGLQQAMGENAYVMIAFEKTDKVERGFFDNDDLDFELITSGKGEGLVGPFVFRGICPWDEFEKEYNDAEDYLVGIDENAPGEYVFNFKDSKGDRINVTGDLITTEALNNKSIEELEGIFGFKAPDNEVAESEHIPWKNIHTSLDSFLNEEKSSGGGLEVLKPEQQVKPLRVAIYEMDTSSYADPAIADKKRIPRFQNYYVPDNSLDANDGESVLVFSSNEIDLTDAKRGIAKVEKGKPKTEKDLDQREDQVDKETEAGDNKEFVTTSKDIKYKERPNTIVIKDREKPGGVNILNDLLSERDRAMLQIKGWKNISKIKVRRKGGIVTRIVFKNDKAGANDKVREYTKVDGEAFEIAKRLVDSVKNDIKYS